MTRHNSGSTLITDETEYVSKKGTAKVDLEKLAKGVEKAKEKGSKGIRVKVEHENAVASRIGPVPRPPPTAK